MPLIPNAREIMRANFELLARGERPLVVTIGYLSAEQHEAINTYRNKHSLPDLASNEVVLMGKHLFRSRVTGDNYTIDDILDQIEHAMSAESMVIATQKMTALKNKQARADRYGNHVSDEAVFEMTQRRPKAELFSVIPKGDKIKPPKP